MTVAGTSPYPWPFDGALRMSTTALVVCGAAGPWTTGVPLCPAAERHLDLLRQAIGAAGLVLLLDHRTEGRWRPGHLTNEPSPALKPRSHEVLVQCAGSDGFYGSPLDHLLHNAGVSHVLLAGRGLETTVHSTLRRANDRGYECLTVADACSPVNPALRSAALSTIEMSGGIFGAVGSCSAVLDALELAPSTPTIAPTIAPTKS